MKTVEQLSQIAAERPSAVAVGFFDGLHLGHQAVIAGACASPQQLEPTVFSFCAQRELAGSKPGAPVLMDEDTKRELLAGLGVQLLVSPPFSQVRDFSAESFVKDILFTKLRAKKVCCGQDFHFGSGASGDVALLERLCRKAGVELMVVPPVLLDGERVSSTAVRNCIQRGEMRKALRFLGRPFSICSEVLHGRQLGRTINSPTINQAFFAGQVVPRYGVYASLCLIDGKPLPAVTNVGIKPTVGSSQVLAETYILNFSGDLYGRKIRVLFYDFLRPEQKFGSVEELKRQIQSDAHKVQDCVASDAEKLLYNK